MTSIHCHIGAHQHRTIRTRTKSTQPFLALAVVALTAICFSQLASTQEEPQMDGMGNISAAATKTNTAAEGLYSKKCAQCHNNPVGRIPPRASMRYRSAEGVYQALKSGVMSPMTEGLSDDEIQSLVKLLTWKLPKDIPDPSNDLCSGKPSQLKLAGDDWSSIHGDNQGQRFRDLTDVTSDSVNRLKLKWAYAYPGSAAGPVTVAGDTLFLAGTGHVIALNAESGCVRWSYPVNSRTVRAVTIGSTSAEKSDNKLPTTLALFGDDSGTVFALDASSGKELWQTKVENHILGRITAAPTVHDGIVYVPISSMEDPLTHDKSYFCCSARGGVAAVDLLTGKQLWKQQHITAPLTKRVNVKTDKALGPEQGEGYFEQGPAGASTYTPLTIDISRGLVYASTAEEYGFTGESGPYSVIAYDLKTGKRAWQQSLLPSPEERSRICKSRETDCRNMFSSGTSVLIHALSDKQDMLVVGQKSGMVHALDPDDGGRIMWSTQVSEGGDLGGVMYGLAADAEKIYVPISDVDSPKSLFTGSLVALDPASGIVVWRAAGPKPACNWDKKHCIAGQVAAVTVVSDMVFAGFWDGYLRIYATDDGQLLREIDTAVEHSAVNGIAGGGQVSGYPVSLGKNTLYVTSGASSIMKSGNALLVYTLDGK